MDLTPLRLQLVQFGLNARHWQLVPGRRRGSLVQFSLRARQTGELRLVGWAKGDVWLSLMVTEPCLD